MKEQSHKDEMSAAIRGDFRRLRERGVAATLAPREEDAPAPVAVDAPGTAPTAPEPVREPEREGDPAGVEPAARPGFFARMLGR